MKSLETRLNIKIWIWVLGGIAFSGSPVFPSTIYDSSIFGINNTVSDTEGLNTFGPTDVETSKQKMAQTIEETKKEIANQICDQAPTDKLCSILPNDNTDFSELFVYLFISVVAQNSFDIFSWQSFVGLNWPSDVDGSPMEGI